MQLRSAVMGADGVLGEDVLLDRMTCSCCQTDAALTEDGLVVVYRDRSPEDLRDIAILRRVEDVWSEPALVHADGWEIAGCPVNGPAVAAEGRRVGVAWFTGADNIPAVKVAFSEDSGQSFGTPVRVDLGQPVGRVDAVMTPEGALLVSWVEWEGRSERLMLCEVTEAGCAEPWHVATNDAGSSVNFPRMAVTEEAIYLAWTQPQNGGGDRVQLVRRAR